MNAMEIEEFCRGRGFGWLSLDGQLLTCGVLEHYQALARSGYHAEWIAYIEQLKDSAGSDQDSFLSSYQDEDHVPWHCYSSDAADRADLERARLAARLMLDGWLRIGSRGRGKSRQVEFEGCASVLGLQSRNIRELGTFVGCEPLLTPVRQRLHMDPVVLHTVDLEQVATDFLARAHQWFKAVHTRSKARWEDVLYRCVYDMTIERFDIECMQDRFSSLAQWGLVAQLRGWSHQEVGQGMVPATVIAAAMQAYVPKSPQEMAGHVLAGAAL